MQLLFPSASFRNCFVPNYTKAFKPYSPMTLLNLKTHENVCKFVILTNSLHEKLWRCTLKSFISMLASWLSWQIKFCRAQFFQIVLILLHYKLKGLNCFWDVQHIKGLGLYLIVFAIKVYAVTRVRETVTNPSINFFMILVGTVIMDLHLDS